MERFINLNNNKKFLYLTIIILLISNIYFFSLYHIQVSLPSLYIPISMAAIALPLYYSRSKLNLIIQKQKTEIEEAHKRTAKALVNAIDAKDRHLEGHSRLVSVYAETIAIELGLSESMILDIYFSALLHDIGKITISESLLEKKSPLTREEWEIIESHPLAGANIVAEMPQYSSTAENILYHHKHYDGGGYPHGDIKGVEIPLGARIIAVADSYHAMTSNRPYRVSLSHKAASEELRRCSGTQFDPEIVEVFLKLLNNDEALQRNVQRR